MNAYTQIIDNICGNIHTGLVDFSLPRNEASIPTLASSEFITNKQQGDWAEDVIFRAINDNSKRLHAVKYGKSDDLVAGDAGFQDFFNRYQNELNTIGKRPDLLLFRIEDFDESLGFDISGMERCVIDNYVRKAVAGIEVRSSAFLYNKYTEEAEKVIRRNTERVIELRDSVLNNYLDLLLMKRAELVPILQQINPISVRTLNFRTPSWRSSQRLQDLSMMLSEIKQCLRIIQKRNSLSITPKVEDLKVVYKWIKTFGVPHFYVQVFFDKIYGISFQHILEMISNPELEDIKYFIEQDTKNQNKTTIKIPSQDGICLAETVIEPHHHSVRKELNKGRLLFYVKFDGGEACLDTDNFEQLFNIRL